MTSVRMKKTTRYQKSFNTLLMLAIGVLFLLPLLWMISSSLKTSSEIAAKGFHWLPVSPRWENYAAIWIGDKVSMMRGYQNSGFITLMSIPVGLLLASMAAYAFAKVPFRGKNFTFILLLSTMMIPSEVTLIPRFMLFHKIGLYNSLWAIILPHWFAPGCIFLLRQFYKTLPDELMEAAKIDGASHIRIFLQIMLPLTKPALISQCVLMFVSCWNDYLSPLIFLVKKKLYTVSQVIQWTMLDDVSRFDLMMTASTLAIVPVFILFFCAQRYFIEGIATSGLKG